MTDRRPPEPATSDRPSRHPTPDEVQCLSRVDAAMGWDFWRAPDGAFVYVSAGCERISGYRAGEFLADPGLYLQVVHPDDRAAAAAHLADIDDEAEASGPDFRIVRRDGAIRWIGHQCHSVFGVDGRFLGRRCSNWDITDRKEAEAALRESEDRYRLLVELAPDAIVVHQDGCFAYANRSALRLHGAQSFEELCGRSVLDLIHPDDRESVGTRFVRLKAGAMAPLRELRVLRLDGRAVQVESLAVPTMYHGKPAIQAIVREITERKWAEKTLVESADRFRFLAEHSPDTLFFQDRDLAYRWILRPTPPHTREQILGKTDGELLPDSDGESLMAIKRRVLETGQPFNGEYSLTIDGVRRTFDAHFAPWHDLHDQLIGIVGYVRDITERKGAEQALQQARDTLERKVQERTAELTQAVEGLKQEAAQRREAEQALQDSELKYRLLFQTESDALILIDAETLRMLDGNDAACRLYGYSRDEFLRLKALDLTSQPAESEEALRQMVLAGSTLVPLRYHRKRDGTVFPVEIAGGRFVLNGRTVIYTAIRDITERERARQELLSHERQLRALVTQLTLAEEAERQRIADGLHDDIAQTLVAARLELDRLSPGASGKVVAAVARTVGQALAQVLAQTRSMTFDLVSPTLHDHGLAFALQDLCERMAQKHGIALVFDTPTTYRPLSGDVEILLYRVVQELLLNVARHAKATQARVQLNQSEAETVVCVEDDGVGFTTDNLSFSPSGGFGLFSIRERVEHLGGRLAVETVEPHGIRVLVTIPSASGPRV